MVKTGNKMKVYICTSADVEENATTKHWLIGEQSSSVNVSAEMIDISDKSTKWQKVIPGMKSGTIDVTVHAYENEDDNMETQHRLISSLHLGSPVYIFIGELGEDDLPAFGDFGEAYVTSIGSTYDNGGVASRSLSLQISGALTHFPAVIDYNG